MSTTERAAGVATTKTPPFVDGPFAKKFVIACALAPGVLLAWDAYRHQLGVNDVNFAIRTTGLLGIVALTLTLLVTPLRRLTGWNVLLSVRRNLGVFGFVYIALHFLLFFAFDRAGSVASTLEEVVERPYLWFGTGALVLMIPLAITSTDGMVTRLGAKRWKLLHRATYLVVLGGVIHYYLLVKADTTKPMIFAIAFGVLIAYRIVAHYVDLRSLVRTAQAKVVAARAASTGGATKKKFWSGQLVVKRIFQETPDVKTFRLALPGGGPLPFTHVAGQYINLKLTIGGKRVNRSYTIASAPSRSDYVEVSIKRARDGYASHHMHDTVTEGTVLSVSAPAGKFVFAGHEADKVVLVAGGVGITPMMSIVRALTDRSWTGEIYLLFSVRKRTDVVFAAELAYLQARHPNLHVLVALSDDADPTWEGARGQLTPALIEGFVPAPVRGPVLLCGPDPMMSAMRKIFVGLGVPDAEVWQEAFVSPPQPKEGEPEPAEQGAEGADDGVARAVRFERAGKTVETTGLTVLEAAEDCGVTIPFECRSGICGQCKTKLVSGRVAMDVSDALTSGDKAKGLILACQARPVQDVVIDA